MLEISTACSRYQIFYFFVTNRLIFFESNRWNIGNKRFSLLCADFFFIIMKCYSVKIFIIEIFLPDSSFLDKAKKDNDLF